MNPFSVDNYVHGYLDRRMRYLIEEWDLSRKGDVGDFAARVGVLEKEIGSLKGNEEILATRMAALEERAGRLRGSRK